MRGDAGARLDREDAGWRESDDLDDENYAVVRHYQRGEKLQDQGKRSDSSPTEPLFAVRHAPNSVDAPGGSVGAGHAHGKDGVGSSGARLSAQQTQGDVVKQLWQSFENENKALYEAAQDLVQTGDPVATNKLLQDLEKEMEADEDGAWSCQRRMPCVCLCNTSPL